MSGDPERLRNLGAHARREDVNRLNSLGYLFVVAAEIAIDHVQGASRLDDVIVDAAPYAPLFGDHLGYGGHTP